MRRPAAPWVVTLLLGAAFVAPDAAHASPITLDLQGRVTNICEVTAAGDIECAPVSGPRFVPVVVTYESDALTVTHVGNGWIIDAPLAEVSVGLPVMANPFGGTTTRTTGGQLFFSDNGPGYIEYREGGIVTAERSYEEVCSPSGRCGWNFWVASAGIGDYRVRTPPFLLPPTAADFEAFLSNGSFSLENYAQLFDPETNSLRYVPGSRWYTGHIPEPPAVITLAVGALVAGGRHGWGRVRRRIARLRTPTR
jgi:hypothetical protein